MGNIKTDLILNYMSENNLTKQAFYKKCGISLYLINNVLSGKESIKMTTAVKIADLLNIRLEQLIKRNI